LQRTRRSRISPIRSYFQTEIGTTRLGATDVGRLCRGREGDTDDEVALHPHLARCPKGWCSIVLSFAPTDARPSATGAIANNRGSWFVSNPGSPRVDVLIEERGREPVASDRA